MSVADMWGRFFWSVIIAIFVGLVWLKFIDSVVPCVWPGLIVATIVGGVYFYLGWRRATRAVQADESAVEGEL
jgi:hypothetical protein